MDLRRRFKEFRLKSHPTQDSLSADSGVSRKHIVGIESGAVNPTIRTLEALLRSMGVSLAEFFESKIPNVYAVAEHAELHEKLQEILEGTDKSKIECMRTAIETFYGAMKEPHTQAIKEAKSRA